MRKTLEFFNTDFKFSLLLNNFDFIYYKYWIVSTLSPRLCALFAKLLIRSLNSNKLLVIYFLMPKQIDVQLH
jgi:hypothetical protein